MGQTLLGIGKNVLTRVLRSCFKISPLWPAEQVPYPFRVEEASFSRRLAALFADWTLSYFVAVFLSAHHLGSVRLLQYPVFYVELLIFTSITGASVGQNLMKVKVVRYPDGKTLAPGYIAIRSLLILLVLPTFITKNGRTLHNIAGRSMVINALAS
jgi:uncharacterized RDD family membrane protein YckC